MTSPLDFPICLYANGTVAIGAVFTPNADDLQNHFDTPIQIEEIRFLLYVKNKKATAMQTLAGLVRAQIKVGRIDLTNGFVPLWLLGSRLQIGTEVLNGYVDGTYVTVWEYCRWKLPCPMIVPAGSTLLPTFTYLTPDGGVSVSDAANSPITVHVALIGRSLPEMPQGKLRVPYATAWISDPTAGGQQSQDDQLVNKFGVPLHVQRLVGRLARKISGGGNESWTSDEGQVAASLNKNLMIKSSDGYHIVGTMTPWFDVFDLNRKVLQVGSRLEPRGWYTAFLADKPTTTYLPMISMIGWRDEEVLP